MREPQRRMSSTMIREGLQQGEAERTSSRSRPSKRRRIIRTTMGSPLASISIAVLHSQCRGEPNRGRDQERLWLPAGRVLRLRGMKSFKMTKKITMLGSQPSKVPHLTSTASASSPRASRTNRLHTSKITIKEAPQARNISKTKLVFA